MNSATDPAQSNSGIYSYTPTSPPSPFQRMLAELEELRKGLAVFTSVMGVTNCGVKFLMPTYKSGKREIVEVTDRCGNKHVCPPCMSYQYSKLRKRFRRSIEGWINNGGFVYTQTLTLPNRSKRLIYKHEDLAKVWCAMTKGKRFSSMRKHYGMKQYLRILEDLLSTKGSFPHFHLTWFFENGRTEDDAARFCDEVANLWAQVANKSGARGTQAARQWYGPISQSVSGYVNYMLKHGYYDQITDPNNFYSESKRLKPLDFLRVLVRTSDYAMVEVWLDYEVATRSLHRVQPSKNFTWETQSDPVTE